jgi:hypothetical protein
MYPQRSIDPAYSRTSHAAAGDYTVVRKEHPLAVLARLDGDRHASLLAGPSWRMAASTIG